MWNHRIRALGGASLMAAVISLAAFSGCVAAAEEGRVSFFVKDAPIDELSSLFVTFSKVEIHRVGADHDDDANESEDDADDNETEDDDQNETDEHADAKERRRHQFESRGEDRDPSDMQRGSWVTVVNETLTIDLKKFTGNDSAFLGALDVAPGKYNQVRIHVDSAYGIGNGTEVNVTVPSGVLKITYRWEVLAGEATAFTVDFDLSRSIVKLPDGTYILKPHLKLDVERKDRHEDREEADRHLAREPRHEWRERGRSEERRGGPGESHGRPA